MRYLIDGCYGDGNVGDECLLLAVSQLIGRVDPDAQIAALTSDIEATEAETGVPAIAQCNPLGSNLYGSLVKGLLAKTLHQIRQSDVFILGGGELLRDQPGYQAVFGMFYRMQLARQFGKTVLALGVGAQAPTRWWGNRVLRKATRACDAVVCRDVESLEIVQGWQSPDAVSLALPDLVFSLDWEPDRQRAAARRATTSPQPLTIGIALKSLPASHRHGVDVTGRLLPALLEAVRQPAFDGCRFQILPFADSDVAMAESFRKELRQAGGFVLPPVAPRIQPLRQAVSELDALVALPLHASVFGFSCGIPTLGLAYDRKIVRLYEGFGVHEFCLEPQDWNTAILSQRLEALRHRRFAVARQVGGRAIEAGHQVREVVGNLLTMAQSRTFDGPSVVAGRSATADTTRQSKVLDLTA